MNRRTFCKTLAAASVPAVALPALPVSLSRVKASETFDLRTNSIMRGWVRGDLWEYVETLTASQGDYVRSVFHVPQIPGALPAQPVDSQTSA